MVCGEKLSERSARPLPQGGGANRIGAAFCSNYGSPLQGSPPTLAKSRGTPSGAPYTPRAHTYDTPTAFSYDDDVNYHKRREIDRTKTGLLLLIVGLLVGPVPFIGIIGGILEIIGAILVILGRNAFGKPHSNYAIWSVERESPMRLRLCFLFPPRLSCPRAWSWQR